MSDSGGFGGFRDDDDFNDLLPAPRTTASITFDDDSQSDSLDANPFADMESSQYHQSIIPSIPTSTSTSSSTSLLARSYSHSAINENADRRDSSFTSSYSPPTSTSSSAFGFSRENAPPPETPNFNRQTSTYSSHSTQAYSPPPAAEQTPFGSPPISPTSLYSTKKKTPADLSDLLGEETPILPSFGKRRMASAFSFGSGEKEDIVLPVSSLGKKVVGGPLATLLGLEDETAGQEEEHKEDRTTAEPVAFTASQPATTSKPDQDQETTPTKSNPSLTLSIPTPQPAHTSITSLTQAASIPLPPSPSTSPPVTSNLAPSPAPSIAPSETDGEPTNSSYASIVSPMDSDPHTNGETTTKVEEGGESNEVKALGEKLESLNVRIDDTNPRTEADTITPSTEGTPTQSLPTTISLPTD
ncbi:hypothetical protein P7C70_g9083, partial [Phenoliferia sp. Uapishka_3]